MCGITGFVDFSNSTANGVLTEMTDVLAHRGPDGDGQFFSQETDYQIGLGHRRLSIIDLSASASQPMWYDDLSIVFNGEIYNYNEIRDELIGLGHQFKAHSDTEVILHAWRQWGQNCLNRFRGMYAMVLFDNAAEEIIAIRDRPGIKPLNYYFADNIFLFSSELKSFLKHPGFTKKINPAAAASFLQYGYVPWPHCIYDNTYKLAPGHILRLNLRTRQLDVQSYWNVYDYYDQPKLKISLPEAIEETERILQQAFEYRMVADVPVGVFLSGGYDSTCVTALLQQGRTEKIKTFTIGAADRQLDEAPFAKEIAARLGTDHTEYYCTADEALKIIPELPYYYDEPFADSSAIPTILVSRIASKKVTVALSADGGDEIFAGYNRYDYIQRFGDRIRAIPGPFRKALVAVMDKVPSEKIPLLRNTSHFHGRYSKFKNLLNDPTPAELLNNLTQTFSLAEINELFTVPVARLQTAHNAHISDRKYDSLCYMMAVDYQTYMIDDILQKVDRATMSASLEGREPFLDQYIIEWAARIPSEYKYHQKTKKYILKEIVHKYVPKDMMERPKMGFAIPVEQWLCNELKPTVMEYLSEYRLKQHGLFNLKVVSRIMKEFYGGRKEKHLHIWYLLMFQMWYEKWFTQ